MKFYNLFKTFILFVAILNVKIGWAHPNLLTCPEYIQKPISVQEAHDLLKTIDKEFKEIPADIKIAIEHGLMPEEEFTNYINTVRKFQKRAPKIWKKFERWNWHRRFVSNGDLTTEYALSVGSSVTMKFPAYADMLKDGFQLKDSPLINDIIGGAVLSALLTTVHQKPPNYYKALLERGLLTKEAINKMEKKGLKNGINVVVKNIKKIDKIATKHANAIVQFMVNKKIISNKFRDKYIYHVRNMMELGLYYFTAGAVSGAIFWGQAKALALFGADIPIPFEGFSPMKQAMLYLAFSVTGYIRYDIAKNFVISRGKYFIYRKLRLGEVDPTLIGNEKSIHDLPPGERRLREKIAKRRVFLLSLATYMTMAFTASYWLKEWREDDWDIRTLMLPFRNDVKQLIESLKKDTEILEKQNYDDALASIKQ
jgi:hypothetical protein